MAQCRLRAIRFSQYLQQFVGKRLAIEGVHHTACKLANLNKWLFCKGVVATTDYVMPNRTQDSVFDGIAMFLLRALDSRDNDVCLVVCEYAEVL